MRFPLGTFVVLKDPLPSDGTAPWKVMGVKPNTAPPLYKLMRSGKKGVPAQHISADEGELVVHEAAPARKV